MRAESGRPALAWTALALAVPLSGAAMLLAVQFLTGDIGNALVFRHAAHGQPWPLRLAGLWASDQGTLLLLALLLSWAGVSWCRRDGWAGPGALLLALCLALGAVAWNPFEATPAEALVGPAPRHNSHLANPWMLIHPPLTLAALALLLAPAGAALEALFRPDARSWSPLDGGGSRIAWIVLSASLASGMWWAYQDVSFGQFWHWDPVQTAIFAVWLVLTAQLHAAPAHGRFVLARPLLALAAAILALVAMTVVRLPQLASSHRYVGDTSAPLLAGMALVLTLAGVAALIRRPATPAGRRDMLDAAIVLMLLCAAIALAHLGHALLAEASRLPRPDRLKPFLDMLLRWATPAEAEELRRAFARWEPDPVAINAWLLPPAIALFLAGGHVLLPWGQRRAASLTALAAVALTVILDPVSGAFEGGGSTAAGTLDQLDHIGGLWAALAYFGLASLVRLATALREGEARPALVGGLHLGLAVALASFLAATVFDRVAQQSFRWPDQAGAPLRLPDGQSIAVSPDDAGLRVTWRLDRDGVEIERSEGAIHILDPAPVPAGLKGAQRLACEILDYRYARQVSATRAVDPFIHRGLWRDVQVWIPAVDDTLSTGLPVVVRTFPLVSWLWGGLGLALLSAAGLALQGRPR
ncbi:cytochrome c biogenesis protein CcsA [Magnetospirillum sp. SS-4]|uniref:cytochrome c biogenesis protein CcsA n=1 Tax=Magnetospirillum sp. SS-4 TaxID=2681465 RepID=UPI0013826F01|nr:cytochrome c biogenesis protein CcsA [Magnetospirillum sp. SS-4]CAA7612309.1 Cytochrome c-type biogenesis protein CcmF (modular protein) [Magnetospirillum sp. SS-4]